MGGHDRDNEYRLMRFKVCKAYIKYLAACIALIAFISTVTACVPQGQTGAELYVINADSLMLPFQELAETFEAQNPDVDVLIEGHGSIQVIRQVTELGAEADVLAVADYSLIPMMMYDVKIPGTSNSYADWYMIFATNNMVVAYTSQSKYAEQINAENWYEILGRPDVVVGMSDPRFDSSGYRALMTCQLAELYYGNDSVFEDITGEFSPSITVTEANSTYTIDIPQVIRPSKMSIRGSSIALLSTLQSGDIDYAFLYESVAEQHGLQFIQLPPEIDLFTDDFKTLCSGMSVTIDFQRFASVNPEFECQPISYGITIPQSAKHSELATEFIEFIYSEEGLRIFEEFQHPLILPPLADNPDNLPSQLGHLIR